MKFAREAAVPTGVAAAAAVAASLLLGEAAGVAGAVLATGVLLFFRDPDRRAPADPAAVVSPADGRVVAAEAGAPAHRFYPGSTTKVAIFMSPLDVHVNRSPLEATVARVEHRPGRFGAAYRADAGDINESTSMLLRTASGAEVVVVQIAGWLARRIVCHATEGRRLARGERFGLIMFGSRVDVHLPPGATLAVSPGQVVKAGETVLARLDGAATRNESQAA